MSFAKSVIASQAWHARDLELAEKDRRIEELEGQLVMFREVAYKWNEQLLGRKAEIAALEARIQAGLALSEEWIGVSKKFENEPEFDGGCGFQARLCADELLAALGEKK